MKKDHEIASDPNKEASFDTELSWCHVGMHKGGWDGNVLFVFPDVLSPFHSALCLTSAVYTRGVPYPPVSSWDWPMGNPSGD